MPLVENEVTAVNGHGGVTRVSATAMTGAKGADVPAVASGRAVARLGRVSDGRAVPPRMTIMARTVVSDSPRMNGAR